MEISSAENKIDPVRGGSFSELFIIPVLLALYLTGTYSYLLFHSLSEIFAVIIAFGIFMLTWNARHLIENKGFVFLGIAHLFIGSLDLIHALAYKGMGVFQGYGTNLSVQLWIAARYMEGAAFLIFPFRPFLSGRGLNHKLAFAGFSAAFALAVSSIFYFKVFPDCYVEGAGLTGFKTASEYIISAAFAASAACLFVKRQAFDAGILRLVIASLIFKAVSELAFTHYIDVYGAANMAGHLLKLVSFHFVYLAVIKTGLVRPFSLISTNLKRSEAASKESEKKLRVFLNAIPEFAFLVDTKGNALVVNQALSQWLGKAPSELEGSPIYDFLPAYSGEAGGETYLEKVIRTGKPVQFEGMRWGRHIANFKYPVLDSEGRTESVAVLGMDITERKLNEEKVRRLNEDLREYASRIEAANKDLESFSYSVSHDLRAPLRAIDGFSRILTEEYSASLDSEGKRLLGVVRGNAQKMAQLIDDILAFSRVGRKEIEFAAVNMRGLAEGVLEEIFHANPNENIKIEIGELPAAFGDRAMMRLVFANLVSNAIKFTGQKERPVIEIGGVSDGTEAVYHVRDNGAGFDMRYSDKLFGVFQRIHGSEEFEGTGIGLAIVKRVIEKHGGRVWAEGKIDEGACFYFSLPVKGEKEG